MQSNNHNKLLVILISSLFFLTSCEIEVGGCIDQFAYNYDPLADYDDGSCLYYSGCMDPAAINYDPAAGIEPFSACDYSCDVVYYLEYDLALSMSLIGPSYYAFWDNNNQPIGIISGNILNGWSSPPNCTPLSSTLTTTLTWSGNSGNSSASFGWAAYPNDGPIADFQGSFYVYPNECTSVGLSLVKIQEFKES
tara:strand:- start:1561 stop:2142 length:582 start_codon:yes stop_codon:yes gene_type:complete